MQCDNGLTYQACGASAPQTCKNLGPDRDVYYDPVPPNEGCFCPDGYFKEGKWNVMNLSGPLFWSALNF